MDLSGVERMTFRLVVLCFVLVGVKI